MTVRSDFSVDFEVSPRLVEITSASLEVSVQDSHDTLSNIQDSPEGGQFDFLVTTTGGEDLGGGTTVGLTTVLNNAQYAFRATSPISTGSVTSNSSTHLIDTSATFVTSLVKRGDWIINFTDQSVTEVLEVVSEISLRTRGLRDGTSNTFTTLDNYKVWEVAEAGLAGGNFTAVDSLSADLSPVFPVFGRTFSLTASSSATATSQNALEVGLLAGKIVVDPVNGYAGTGRTSGGVLIGTFAAPSNNMTDAHSITHTHSINHILILNNITIDIDLSHGFILEGSSPFTAVYVDPTADVTGAVFNNMSISGELDGLNSLYRCFIGTVTNASGFVENCSFESTMTINGDIKVFNCISNISGGGYPTLTTSVGNSITVRDFHGSLGLDGIVDGHHSIGGDGGRCVVEAGCTGGIVHIRGSWFEIVDNSGVGCTVVDERSNLTEDQKLKLEEIHKRLDLDTTKPNVYTEDPATGRLTQVVSDDFTLISSKVGNDTTVQRS